MNWGYILLAVVAFCVWLVGSNFNSKASIIGSGITVFVWYALAPREKTAEVTPS